jgi:hypothetical protein
MPPADDVAGPIEADLDMLRRQRTELVVHDVIFAAPDHLDRAAGNRLSQQRLANKDSPFIGMTQLCLRPAMGHPRPQSELAKSVFISGRDGLRRQQSRLLGLAEHEE